MATSSVVIPDSMQAQLTSLQSAYQSALNNWQSQTNNLAIAKANAQDCQQKRDGRSTAIGKNSACNINTLHSLNAEWNDYATKVTAAAAIKDSAYAAIGTYQSQIDKWVAQKIESLKADPAYNLANTAAQAAASATVTGAQAQAAAQKAKADADAQAVIDKAKSRKIVLIIVGSAAGFLILVIAFIYVMTKEKKHFEPAP